MSKKVILFQCSGDFWVEAAARLESRYGWDVLYWTASDKFAADIRRRFPKTIFQATKEAVFGLPAPGAENIPPMALDEPLLTRLAEHESIVLKMMDRLDASLDFTYGDRLALYHRLLSHWGGMLDHLQPDLAVFCEPPHAIFDYVAYSLCLDRSIQTVMFPANPVFPSRALPVAKIDCHSPALEQTYERLLAIPEADRPTASSDALRYIEQASLPQDQAPVNYYVASRLQNSPEENAFTRIFRDWLHPRSLKYKTSRAWDFLTAPAPDTYEKQRGKDLTESYQSGLAWRLNRFRGDKLRGILQRTYMSLCRPPDWDRPFVYVALHYQPEQTTSPSGGVFVHQDLMVRLLAEGVPDSWLVFVKEHMLQFTARRGHFGRQPSFYRELAKLPNVRLVPPDTSGFKLMDHSQAVATVTGTTGFEAACRSKPVLLFGHAWYQSCRGVFKTHSKSELAQALDEIVKGAKPEAAEVTAFAAAYEQASYRACPNGFLLKGIDLSCEENAAGLTRALLEFCEQT